MTEIAQPPRRIGRSIVAIVVGFVVVFALSVGTDMIFHRAQVYPPPGQPMMDTKLLLLALSYRMVYDGFGSYLAARLAPGRPMFHAMLLGFIGLAAAVTGAIVMREMAPDWYAWTLAATVLPTAWIGGWLFVRSRT